MVAKEPDGPRGDSPLDARRRNEYSNIILLCPTHHSTIDKDVAVYSIPRLIEVKSAHEDWVRTSLHQGGDLAEEQWGQLVDAIATRLQWQNWEVLFQPVFGRKSPAIDYAYFEELTQFAQWLMRRIWPTGHTELRRQLEMLRRLVTLFLDTFDESAHMEPGRALIQVEHIYRGSEHDPEHHALLKRQWAGNVHAIRELALDLTRSCNLFIATVQRNLDARFMFDEGLIAVQIPLSGEMRVLVPEYSRADLDELSACEGGLTSRVHEALASWRSDDGSSD